jgi:hypothetical protein
MKKTIFVTLFVLGLLVFSTTAFAKVEYTPDVYDLFAGQDMDIGDVLVWTDGDTLFVQFKSDVCMLETHLHIATSVEGIPQTKKFNPIPGQFDFSEFHGCSKDFTYEIPRTWAYGDELFIAAHASLGQEMSMMIYSDGELNTMVTAGNVVDAVYPYPALDAWEHPVWNSSLSSPFLMGDWVWESFRTNNPNIEEYVTFQHNFNVPGYPLSGVLHIATDNEYTATINDLFVGEQTDWHNWSQVGHHEFMPLEGANTLQVIGYNYGNDSYNIDSNPAGLIYEAEITYLESDESAWAGTLDFAGKNWATYFKYIVPSPFLVDELIIDAKGAVSCVALVDGESYKLKASGTYFYRTDGISEADAEWAYRIPGEGLGYGDGEWVKGDVGAPGINPYPSVLGLDVSKFAGPTIGVLSSYQNIDWGNYSETHNYEAMVTGEGGDFCLGIYDSAYGDNSGAVTVEVWWMP